MEPSIRFVLGGVVRRLTDVDPTMTVLEFLRTVERRTGTKEGCAEGDCGACTVVVGTLKDDRIRYRAVNSCLQFIATLDGKQLVTIEDLAGPDGALHPAQAAMVACHGSQCGFCTPGIVMSLYARYREGPSPDRAQIDDVLAGNLCRCTGYAPIVEAAAQMTATATDTREDDAEAVALLRTIRRTGTLYVPHGANSYYAPTALNDLASLVRAHPHARMLGGGTDLGLLVTKQYQDLGTVIYVGDVPELCAIHAGPETLEIGAAASLADIHRAIASVYPDFGELLRRFGSVQIRNAASVGGNVATASPIGDTLPCLLALDARVVLHRDGATREIPIDRFFEGYRTTALRPGEFIERILIPTGTDRRFAAYKVSKRFDQDISAVCAAYSLDLEDGSVRDIRIGYGGMAATAKRAAECERRLIGQPWTADAVERAAESLDDEFAPISDMRASAEYRSLVAKRLLRRFHLETTDQTIATRLLALEATGRD